MAGTMVYIISGEYSRGLECSIYKWLDGGRESLMGGDEDGGLFDDRSGGRNF